MASPSSSPWSRCGMGRGHPHHHLDVSVVNGDTADVGGGLPEGDALLVQLTAPQDEAWGDLPRLRWMLTARHRSPHTAPTKATLPGPSGLAPGSCTFLRHAEHLLQVLGTSRHQDCGDPTAWNGILDQVGALGFSQSLGNSQSGALLCPEGCRDHQLGNKP